MNVINELRGRISAVGIAANRAWAEESAHPEADDYEAYAGMLAAITAGSAYITYKMVELGSPVTARDTLLGLGATILSSVGATVFYDKSREARQEDQ